MIKMQENCFLLLNLFWTKSESNFKMLSHPGWRWLFVDKETCFLLLNMNQKIIYAH